MIVVTLLNAVASAVETLAANATNAVASADVTVEVKLITSFTSTFANAVTVASVIGVAAAVNVAVTHR